MKFEELSKRVILTVFNVKFHKDGIKRMVL